MRLIVSKEAAADLVRLREFLRIEIRAPPNVPPRLSPMRSARSACTPNADAKRLSPMRANWSCRSGGQPMSFGTLFLPKPMRSSFCACGMGASSANNLSQFLLARTPPALRPAIARSVAPLDRGWRDAPEHSATLDIEQVRGDVLLRKVRVHQ